MDHYENHGQYRLSAKLVEMIHQDFQGFHPGYRDVHASGRYYAGVFKATPEARKLSRAVHLQGDSVPVTVRYSNSRSGNPWGPATTASMAVRFYLPDGTTTDLVSLPIPLFFARTPEETLEFLEAVQPDPATGAPDPKRIGPFLAARPWVAHAVKLAKSLPASVSLAQTAFHMLHAFRFVNAADEAQYARYHWEPEAGVVGQTLDELQKQPPSLSLRGTRSAAAQGAGDLQSRLATCRRRVTRRMTRMHRGPRIARAYASGSSRSFERPPSKRSAMQ